MDSLKVGKLIRKLRKEKGMTQQDLAYKLNVSNKAVSKWERGNGSPDVSLWKPLADTLGADLMQLLEGTLSKNIKNTGKISRLSFFVCPDCGNIITSTGAMNVTCCGRKLSALNAISGDANHAIRVEDTDEELFISADHEMNKEHYISFAAYVRDDAYFFQKLYPEQNPSFRMPKFRRGGTLYIYCTKDGLFSFRLSKGFLK